MHRNVYMYYKEHNQVFQVRPLFIISLLYLKIYLNVVARDLDNYHAQNTLLLLSVTQMLREHRHAQITLCPLPKIFWKQWKYRKPKVVVPSFTFIPSIWFAVMQTLIASCTTNNNNRRATFCCCWQSIKCYISYP